MNSHPDSFNQFIGQKRLKDTIKLLLDFSAKRETQMDHVLLHGPAGLGKTTLANLIAKEMGVSVKRAQGPLLEKKADILSLFASISNGDVVFIDEIHGISKPVEELLYSAMEAGIIDIPVGTDSDQRIMRVKLPPFTLVGATTKYELLPKTLKDKFGFIGKLKEYSKEEIEEILMLSANKLNVSLSPEALLSIADHSRFNPRTANLLLKRALDTMVSLNQEEITLNTTTVLYSKLNLHPKGLSDTHVTYMKCLADLSTNGSSRIDLSAVADKMDEEEIQSTIVPSLLELGLISMDSFGIKLTPNGQEYLSTYNLTSKENTR